MAKTVGQNVYVTNKNGLPVGTDFVVPQHDSDYFTYFGTTGNIETWVFKEGATTVGTITFEYDGDGGTTSTDRLISRTLT